MLWRRQTGSNRTDLLSEAGIRLVVVFQMDRELLAIDGVEVHRGEAHGRNQAGSARQRRGQNRGKMMGRREAEIRVLPVTELHRSNPGTR